MTAAEVVHVYHAPSVPKRRIPPRLTGPATRAMALDAGIDDKQLRHRDVVRLSRDTYLPRSSAGQLRSRIAAVLLNAPDPAVLSHATAAALWQIAIPRKRDAARTPPPGPTGPAVGGGADRQVHRIPFSSGEVTRHDGFPVTTPARTWRDLAGVLPSAALL